MEDQQVNRLKQLIVMGLVLGSCSQGGNQNSDAALGMTDSAVLRNVTGTRKSTRLSESGATEMAIDLSKVKFSALIQSGSGGFDELIGSGKADGTFSIPNVPPGAYWLRSQSMNGVPTYLFTTADQLDYGFAIGDRADELFPTSTSTKLVVQLSGLFPWQPDCLLVTYVPTLSRWYSWPSEFDSSLMDGDTTWSSTISLSKRLPLIEGGKGDTLYILQLCGDRMANNIQTLRRVYQAPAFTMADGMTSTIMGTMTDVPLDRELRGKWQRSAFFSYAGAISKQPIPMQLPSASFYTTLLPHSGAHGLVSVTADLLFANMLRSDGKFTDLDLDARYGNPFPASWSTVHSTSLRVPIELLAPGATTPAFLPWAGIMESNDLTATTALAPLISPVRQFAVGGKDAQSPQSHIGLNPTLTWMKPETGTANGYAILVGRIYSLDGMNSELPLSTTLYTTQTSATLPPGVLQSGQAYVLAVRALSTGRTDFASAPWREKFPTGKADAVSAVLQVD